MIRELAGNEIEEHLCAHLRDVIAWLRERHRIAPVRGELDIKSMILTLDYDEALTAAAVAEAARAFAGSADLTFEERSFCCRTDWQSAGVARKTPPPPRLLDGLRRAFTRRHE